MKQHEQSQVRVLDPSGRPIDPGVISRIAGNHGKMRASLNGSWDNVPFDAADQWGAHMRAWNPYLWSPDTALNPFRDRIVARMRDMVQNDGWAAGAITRVIDNCVGADFRPMARPDHRWLKTETNAKGFDAQWAHEYGRWAEARFRSWANDPGKWCDIERNCTFGGLQQLAFRHKVVDGDALAMMRWEPERLGRGRALYSTAVHLIDPDRLSNPMQSFDKEFWRGGVVIDKFGAACAYHIREAHQGDWYNAYKSLKWTKIPRETDFGRPVTVHNFDPERAGQHRGGIGILGTVLQRLKMLVKYDGVELDAAIVNSIFGAYLESPFDHELMADALGDDNGIGRYQDMRKDFHDQRNILLGNVRIPTLFPGEKINTTTANRPNANFADFEAAILRNVAAGTGLATHQVSGNYGDANYSSMRAAMLEMWKTMDRRKASFAAGFSHPVYVAFLEEAHEYDAPPLPAGAPDFIEGRHAYGRARWIGPAKGWVDPIAEKEGAWLGMEIGLSTLEDEAADQGRDYEEILDQLEVEAAEFDKRGLNRPSWMGASPRQQEGRPGSSPKEPSPPKPGKKEEGVSAQ